MSPKSEATGGGKSPLAKTLQENNCDQKRGSSDFWGFSDLTQDLILKVKG